MIFSCCLGAGVKRLDPDQVLFDPELDPVAVLDVDPDADPDPDVGPDPGSNFLLPWPMCMVHPGSEIVGRALEYCLCLYSNTSGVYALKCCLFR